MPKWDVQFSNYQLSTFRVRLSIHGHEEDIDAFIDTGFSGGASGVKVPYSLARFARFRYKATVIVGDGEEIPIEYIPDGKIISIDNKSVDCTVPVMFLDGPQVLGCYLLANATFSLNGKKGYGKLNM